MRLPSLQLSERALCDLTMLACDGFAPLDGFLGEADYARVLAEMRLVDGRLWPIPITLDAAAPPPGEVALRDSRNRLLGVLEVREAYRWDRRELAVKVFGTEDPRHPLVAELGRWGDWFLSGPLRLLEVPSRPDFRSLRLTPAETRARLAVLGRQHTVAFQTRNPLHRAHQELIARAAREFEATVLLHPVVGLTQPGDVDHYTRVRTYEAVAEPGMVLALLPLAMRMAGPREALWHALIRRNYGATHFIVGRNHASPGTDSRGLPFYGTYDAQELVRRHENEVGVRMVPFTELVYLPDEDRYVEESDVPAGARTWTLSGTEVREEYLKRGRLLPAWFTSPAVAAILAESPRAGACIWLTGLSCAGKSTIADVLRIKLRELGRQVTLLDGDVVRTHLSKGLGFSREDRDTNILRIGFVASEVVRHGGLVICAAISPYRATREAVRAQVPKGCFLEVFVDTPLAVCEERDEKGLYARARAGELRGFTGVDDPYEPPEAPELRLSTVGSRPEENATQILEALRERGFINGVT